MIFATAPFAAGYAWRAWRAGGGWPAALGLGLGGLEALTLVGFMAAGLIAAV